MSDTPTAQLQQERVKALKQTYSHLGFIHNKFLTTQFYLEEAKQADACMQFVQEMANKIVDEINELEPKVETTGLVTEEPKTNV